jgi:hypothetical protein
VGRIAPTRFTVVMVLHKTCPIFYF